MLLEPATNIHTWGAFPYTVNEHAEKGNQENNPMHNGWKN